jgi:Tol biopolymer transport system component
MRRIAAVGSISLVVLLAWVTGCVDFSGPKRTPASSSPLFIVSKPVSGTLSASASAAFSLAGSAGVGTVYVSLRPGTAPSGVAATIYNRSRGSAGVAFLFAGGFDPVPVVAAAGDTLELDVHSADGSSVLDALTAVPAAAPPVVVRTDPPPGKRDVPLNCVIVVVFSEPLDPRTLTAGSMRLVAGAAVVSGRITLAADGLRAEFQPDQLLQPSTTYALGLTNAVADLGGSRLGPAALDFTTANTAAGVGMSQIVFVGCPQAESAASGTLVCGIFVMNADGSDVRQLSQPLVPFGLEDAFPTWSPDGGRIAFSSFRHCTLSGRQPFPRGGDCPYEIYVMDADGSGLTKLTDLQSVGLGVYSSPAWSPDGGTIAFGTKGALYAVNADGSGLRILTADSMLDPTSRPAWSPDGTRIAVSMSKLNSDSSGIYLMAPDGSNLVQLTIGFANHDGFPSWSPDGTRIAFQRVLPGVTDEEVFVVTADGLNPAQLTSGTGLHLTPSWSPDGTQIVFKKKYYNAAGTEIDVMRADGSGLVRLDTGFSNVLLPAWSPVGTVPPLPASLRAGR